MSLVTIGSLSAGNSEPLLLIGGMNVIESRDLALRVAERFVEITARLGIPFVFKASFDKANRSSIESFRGPGLDKGLRVLEEIKNQFQVSVLTDIHLPSQAGPVAEVCDVIQIPAFLARQTDLIEAAASTKAALHIKKPQFMSPSQVKHVVTKARSFGAEQILVCERGSNFGYDNIVVDMLGFSTIEEENPGVPVTFDVTHALQTRGQGSAASGGRRAQILELTRAAVAVGLAGLFLEAHPDPDSALCDGPSALPLDQLEAYLIQTKALDDLVKGLPELVIC